MAMNQIKSKDDGGQFEYLGKWVAKKHFCAFVYNATGKQLAKNYEEFEKLIGSGIWFVSQDDFEKKLNKSELAREERLKATVKSDSKARSDFGVPYKKEE